MKTEFSRCTGVESDRFVKLGVSRIVKTGLRIIRWQY
jgi:hypothetical protein